MNFRLSGIFDMFKEEMVGGGYSLKKFESFWVAVLKSKGESKDADISRNGNSSLTKKFEKTRIFDQANIQQ